jgi:hypothetical protein
LFTRNDSLTPPKHRYPYEFRQYAKSDGPQSYPQHWLFSPNGYSRLIAMSHDGREEHELQWYERSM